MFGWFKKRPAKDKAPTYQSYAEFLKDWNAGKIKAHVVWEGDSAVHDRIVALRAEPDVCSECARELEMDTEFEEDEDEAQRWADEEAARMDYWDDDEDDDDDYELTCPDCGFWSCVCEEDEDEDEPWPDELGDD